MTEAPARVRLLTEGVPGIGGRIRAAPEDFVVEEIPLYAALAEGEHVLFLLEKRGISTFEAAMWVSKTAKVSEHTIGYAGLKDAHAVTRQWMSVHRVPPERLLAIRHPRIRVLAAARHPSRVRIGHLAGNRFTIRVRGARMDRLDAARESLARLVARGMPNAYGTQRFGVKQDGHLVGRAVVRGDFTEFLAHFLGRPHRREADARVLDARAAYDRGDLEQAQRLFPKHRVQKKALAELLRGGSPEEAFHALGKRPRRIYVSAYQSWLFNRCLDQRLADRLDSSPATSRGSTRAARSTASSTRPPRRRARTDSRRRRRGRFPATACARRRARLSRSSVGSSTPRGSPTSSSSRRPSERGGAGAYRVPVTDASLETEGDDVVVARFTLPPGSFATVLLRELMKNGEGVADTPTAPAEPDLDAEPAADDDAEPDEPTGTAVT